MRQIQLFLVLIFRRVRFAACQPICVTACLGLSMVSVAGAQPFPTNNNPANQIRFDTPAEADAKRSQLVNFIWNGGLPSALPTATFNVSLPSQAIDINPLNVAKVDRLDANVSGWDFHVSSYLIHPKNVTPNANRVVLVQQGHSGTLDAGVGATANHLLQNGFTVAVMEMPLFGWNTDKTAVIPGRGTLTYNDHGQMITNTAVNNDGQGFRLFLEPVVQTINYVSANTPGLQDVGMVGLSGGGWYTNMMAAIDPRIKLSAPVAGSSPLYHRNGDPSSVGDPEQYFTPLYAEDIAADGSGGGVATWLEIYALGAYGQNRHQIQVTNEFDSCCFSGTFADSYKTIVADRVGTLGAGKWEYFRDSTHRSHQISPHAIEKVINPLFGITNPLPAPSGLPIFDGFNDQTNAFPAGWTLDLNNGPGAAAIEKAGHVTIYTTSMASIVRTSPFNPQAGAPMTITVELDSMSSDNFGGVFVTDNAKTRSHQLGVAVNAATKEIALDADNGGGFDVADDRVILGTLPGYNGGAATLKLTFGADGFSVVFDAGTAGTFSSGLRPWSQVPKGFDLANLGDHVQLFLQSTETNGGTGANMVVNSISVQVNLMAGDFDGDGDVDGADFIAWKLHFPTESSVLSADGDADFDFDGDVDGADFAAWQAHYPTLADSGSASVPEHTSIVMMLLGVCLALSHSLVCSK